MESAYINKDDHKSKLTGYAVTTIVHAVLIGLLWWSVLTIPDPPLGYGGMELSMALGEFDMGGPNEETVAEPTPLENKPEQESIEEEVLSQDDDEVAATVKKTSKLKKPTEVKKPTEKPIEKPREVDKRALFSKKTTATNEGGHGDGSVTGNQGNPDGIEGGSPDGNGIGNGLGGSGGGSGTGIGDGMGSFDLKGRSLSKKPDIIDNSRETGKVVVGITVDRSGKVIKVQPGIKGTTNLSPALLEKARLGALDARFSPRNDGQDEQYGTMTFVFRFKQ